MDYQISFRESRILKAFSFKIINLHKRHDKSMHRNGMENVRAYKRNIGGRETAIIMKKVKNAIIFGTLSWAQYVSDWTCKLSSCKP